MSSFFASYGTLCKKNPAFTYRSGARSYRILEIFAVAFADVDSGSLPESGFRIQQDVQQDRHKITRLIHAGGL